MSWQDAAADSPNNLTQKEAQVRHSLISPGSVEYRLRLNLDNTSKDYTGSLIIRFTLQKAPTNKGELFIDFVGEEISSFTANGEVVKENPFSGLFLKFRSRLISLGNRIELFGLAKEGQNTLEINYKNLYNTDGAGFHRFVDPEDGEVLHFSDLFLSL